MHVGIEIHSSFFREQKSIYWPTMEPIDPPMRLTHSARKLVLVVDEKSQFLAVRASPLLNATSGLFPK